MLDRWPILTWSIQILHIRTGTTEFKLLIRFLWSKIDPGTLLANLMWYCHFKNSVYFSLNDPCYVLSMYLSLFTNTFFFHFKACRRYLESILQLTPIYLHPEHLTQWVLNFFYRFSQNGNTALGLPRSSRWQFSIIRSVSMWDILLNQS